MAGNTCILKHSSNTPESGVVLEEIFREAGFEDAFMFLPVGSDKSELILSDFRVKGVSFTGSVGGGKAVAEIAGRYAKKCVMELGGPDPFIILEDADLRDAAKNAAIGRFKNSGQSCNNSKRFLVPKQHFGEFVELLKKEIEKYPVGDPYDPKTKIGPLARYDLTNELKKQTLDSIKAGAKLLYGNEEDLKVKDKSEGNYFHPVIIANPPKDSPAYKEELFGPVFTLFETNSEEEAIHLANDTVFGLSACIATQDIKNAERIAKFLDVGSVTINDSTKSDPNLPYGGVKESGYGRECGDDALLEFTNHKSVWIRVIK